MNFQALFDPATTLGAFLISISSSLIVGLILGFFSGKRYKKVNKIKARDIQAPVNQDVKYDKSH